MGSTRLICSNGLNVPTKPTKRKRLTKDQKEAQELWDNLCRVNNIPTMKERYGKNAPFI